MRWVAHRLYITNAWISRVRKRYYRAIFALYIFKNNIARYSLAQYRAIFMNIARYWSDIEQYRAILRVICAIFSVIFILKDRRNIARYCMQYRAILQYRRDIDALYILMNIARYWKYRFLTQTNANIAFSLCATLL